MLELTNVLPGGVNFQIGVGDDGLHKNKLVIANGSDMSNPANIQMVIDQSNGNVGIGTTSPLAKLHLNVPDDGGLRIQAGENGWGSARLEFWSDPQGPGEWRPGFIASGDAGGYNGILEIYTNKPGDKTEPVLGMSINNGNVNVKNELLVNGIRVIDNAGNWVGSVVVKDYVFDKNYPLKPLGELEEFITREKHLPNVPGAAEIKEKGINIIEFQMILLEKIEELTLYTLAQQKRIEALEARLND